MLPEELKTLSCEKVEEVIIMNFINFIKEAGITKGVIGLSGGVDSSTSAFLSVKAFDPQNLYALMMPSEISLESDLNDAIKVAELLGINYEIIPIQKIVDALNEVMEVKTKVAIMNRLPRVRMTLLYSKANEIGAIVVGSGNKTELSIGYFTKYGDGGIDVTPIGDLYKSQVRQLAYYLGVPKKIIEKPPSPGLWPGQTDEGEIGIKYDVIDTILFLWLDKNYDETLIHQETGISKEIIQRVMNMVERSQHKRNPPVILSSECGT